MSGATTGRLSRRQDFERVFGQGRAVAARLLVLRFVPGVAGQARVGVAVGRQLGCAVIRNRLRRRWREVVRLGPGVRRGWDLVLVARASGRAADCAALTGAWREALRRAGLLGGAGE